MERAQSEQNWEPEMEQSGALYDEAGDDLLSSPSWHTFPSRKVQVNVRMQGEEEYEKEGSDGDDSSPDPKADGQQFELKSREDIERGLGPILPRRAM
ncbi:unnamed protein product [Linum trigynum]|uniref:Uncharacterized protein n=1 Tax=Linum trigynum TaxID=586398 RepID=A0AAV2ER82_9ROSI